MTPSARSQGPGYELDALVAEKVMGWTRGESLYPGVMMLSPGDVDVYRLVPSFSTDIAAAWTVVEKLRERDCHTDLDSLGFHGEEWRCAFTLYPDDDRRDVYVAEAATAPHAICLAALAAFANADVVSPPDDGGAER